MREFKDSNIEWIGEIPSNWICIKNKFLLSDSYSGGTPKADNSSFYSEDGFPFISIADMSSLDYVTNTEKKLTPEGIESKKLQTVPAGSVIYSMYATVGHVAETLIDAKISQAMIALYINDKIDKQFYKYNLRAINDYIHSSAEGTTQMNLNAQKVYDMWLVLPPKKEQKQIAAYLDKKCSDIDDMIEKRKLIIEKITEYQDSIISTFVYKDINNNRKQKINRCWINEIPENWEIKPLKTLFGFSKGLSITKDDLIDEKQLGVISYGQIHSKSNKGTGINEELIRYVPFELRNNNSLAKKNSFIFADTSEDLEGCGNCVYVDSDEQIYGGYHTIVLNPKNDCDYKYFSYLFKTDLWRYQIRRQLTEVKLYSVTQSVLSAVDILVPPYKVQERIVKQLDDICMPIDKIIEKQKDIIDKLKEYKQSIIYNAVTGKIDCRKEDDERRK